MFSKQVTYKDYNGVERNEEIFFNLNKMEFMELSARLQKSSLDLDNLLKAPEANASDILAIFKEFVLSAYGEKSADGRYFMKTDKEGNPLGLIFSQSAAYYQLLNDIVASPDASKDFISNCLPEEIRSEVLSKAAETTEPIVMTAATPLT